MLRRQAFLATYLTVLGTIGCATTGEKADALTRSVSQYNDAFRWKNYQLAAAYLPAQIRTPFIANYDEDDHDLHIEGYQIIGVEMVTPEVAKVQVRYQYTLLPSVTLEKRIVTQHWAIVEGQWILEHEDRPIRPLELPPEIVAQEAEAEEIEEPDEWPTNGRPWYEPTLVDDN
ncbi:MAG: hypothetical protein KTR25_19665 [Myxococcales bacterium]|nr:hypothetical protein [Myxococcales bacterium]